jgi:hypothetical protein
MNHILFNLPRPDSMSDFDIKGMLFSFDQWSGSYLRDEVEEALLHREELTPHLIKVIETVADNPLLYSLEQRNAHVYAATLLAHFEEPAAHLPIIRAFCIPEEQLFDLWGDMTTEILPTLLYRTSGGLMAAIKELIVNRTTDQYVRCAAMDALSYTVALQPALREEVVCFFQGLFTGEEAERDSIYWGNLAALLCDLHPGGSMEILRQAHAADLIPSSFIGWEDIEAANGKTVEAATEQFRMWVSRRIPADVHGYLSWFAEFRQQEPKPPPANPKKQGKKKTKTKSAKTKGAKKVKKKKN